MSTVEFKLKAHSKVGFVDNIDIIAAKKTIEKLLQSDLVSFEIEELPAIPEVKMIETGILMSPAEMCKCGVVAKIGFKVHADSYCELLLSDENIGKRIVISSRVFPREFYRDIETTWDFSSIPVGSLIKIEHINGEPDSDYFGRYKGNDDKHCLLHDGVIFKSNIKSIRIVEGAKE